jgi:hypothetical protein
MSLSRNGAPSQQLFILGSTILAEGAGRLITNAIIDPNFIRVHYKNIRAILHGDDTANVYFNPQAEQAPIETNSTSCLPGSSVVDSTSGNILGSNSSSSSVPGGTYEIAKSILGVDIDLVKFYDTVLSQIINYLIYIFEPVHHGFTIELMSNHVQNISVLLIIITGVIFIFFISLLFNLTLFLFSGRLLNYFKNKYIL